jgi:hypothetical protein
MSTFFFSLKPNARRQAPPIAAATEERRLLAVACTRLFGALRRSYCAKMLALGPIPRISSSTGADFVKRKCHVFAGTAIELPAGKVSVFSGSIASPSPKYKVPERTVISSSPG